MLKKNKKTSPLRHQPTFACITVKEGLVKGGIPTDKSTASPQKTEISTVTKCEDLSG